jgi:hypothetical protein
MEQLRYSVANGSRNIVKQYKPQADAHFLSTVNDIEIKSEDVTNSKTKCTIEGTRQQINEILKLKEIAVESVGDLTTTTDVVEHVIKIKGDPTPKRHEMAKLPFHHEEEFSKTIDDLLQSKRIQPSN